jgi:hypothetical protein
MKRILPIAILITLITWPFIGSKLFLLPFIFLGVLVTQFLFGALFLAVCNSIERAGRCALPDWLGWLIGYGLCFAVAGVIAALG